MMDGLSWLCNMINICIKWVNVNICNVQISDRLNQIKQINYKLITILLK